MSDDLQMAVKNAKAVTHLLECSNDTTCAGYRLVTTRIVCGIGIGYPWGPGSNSLAPLSTRELGGKVYLSPNIVFVPSLDIGRTMELGESQMRKMNMQKLIWPMATIHTHYS